MSEIPTTKKYPQAPAEISEILGMSKASGHEDHSSAAGHELPVVESHAVSKALASKTESHAHADEPETLEETSKKMSSWKRVLKTAVPYVAVFGVGILLYYFFLSNTDFSGIVSKLRQTSETVKTVKETALDALKSQNQVQYQAWANQYYFAVSDASVTDMDADNSGNGLTNFQKFMLGLNPKSYDTLGLGMADSQALAAGINPKTGSALNDQQKTIVEKYFDMEIIMNRLTVANINRQNVAGASTGINTGTQNNFNTPVQTGNTSQGNTAYTAPLTGANITTEDPNIDLSKPGLLEIPSLKVSAPIVWSSDPKNFDTDLQNGVIHYPGTAMPGQIGTVYISGHSSNVPWAKGAYNKVFSKLGNLADNASFTLTVYTKDGKAVKYHFVVKRRAEYQATDQEQFKNAGVPTVALSTCWPVNTTQKRLVVFGELTQVEK
ncbi:MAG: sortase [Candidatus Doudnabacteria bacterium]|nr:sortase [Candidatus Doudnabacteria bacterium]